MPPKGLPMPSSAVRTFDDPYEYQTSIRAGGVKVVVTAAGAFHAELTRIDLHRLWMQRNRVSLPIIAHVAMHKNRCAIMFPTDPQQISTHQSGMALPFGDVVFNSLEAEFYLRSFPHLHWGSMSLTPEDLSASGRALVGDDVIAPAMMRVIRPPPDLMSRLIDLHNAAGHLAATVPDILAHPEVARAMEQQLVRTMIACLTDQATAERSHANHHRVAVMRRFEQLAEAHQAEPLYLPETCAALGVTHRTLRLHCQEHLGMGPHRYLWLRRMHLARRALALADGTTRTVTEIANDHGFGELGRFAVSYRQLFGESPSVTLRRPPDDRRTLGIGQFKDIMSVPA
jgi:AraC-like DNA-binding protein